MTNRPALTLLICLSAAAIAGDADAADGQIEINQAIAMAGGLDGDLGADPPVFPLVISQPGS
jgi:hypothetical protein